MPKNYIVFGLAGTGKDTFARLMRKHLGVETLALADRIRDEYVRFYGTDDYKTNRQRMIDIGEGYKRIYGEYVWCRELLKRADFTNGILITDGRHPVEYDFFVRKFDFIPIRLIADDSVRFERLKQRDGKAQRESLFIEKKNFIPDGYKAINVTNNGTIAELEETVKELFK